MAERRYFVTHEGITMDVRICRNRFGKLVIRGWVDGEERMGHEVAEDRSGPDSRRIHRAIIYRIEEIKRERKLEGLNG